MLANPYGNGACGAFSMMLIDMFRLHGINRGTLVRVTPNRTNNPAADTAVGFLVKNWGVAPLPPKGPILSGDNWSHTMSSNVGWMNGAGQNEQNPMPWFSSHYIVKETITGNYYDPSYGSAPQQTHPAWENAAINGLVRRLNLPPNVGFFKGALGAPATVLVLTPYPFPIY